MKARIEIRRDNKWHKLHLRGETTLKYNDINNKIASISQRKLSHSNTFSLPFTSENIAALDLNVFNKSQLAFSLNKKYEAKYYVGEVQLKAGSVVINNVSETINLNFYDESLTLVEKWAGTTYKEMLSDSGLPFPADYAAAIVEMREFVLNQDNIVVPLTNVGTRGYPLALFPNNLNTIGDEFQKNDQGWRDDQSFNPYQARPLFNVKALFDLAIYTYGYTADYDDSIDWERIKSEYIVPDDDTAKKYEEETEFLNKISEPVASNSEYWNMET